MKKVINPVTKQVEYQIEAKMVSPLSETTLANKNGKNYKLVTVEFADVNSVVQRASAAIYEGNYSKGVKQGETYLCTARKADDGRIYLQMSHLLAGAGFATADMFDAFDEAPIKASVNVSARELAS